MKKLLPVLFLLLGTGAGVGAGIYLRPKDTVEHKEVDAAEHDKELVNTDPALDADHPAPLMEYVKLSNQFVIPVVNDRAVVALVVISLSLEVPEGQKDTIFKREPKLRDSFLQVMFDHANMGGFEGEFTETRNLAVLRNALREVGQKDVGEGVIHDVLIHEIARQDY